MDDSKNRRKFPRFKVADFDQLNGRMSKWNDNKKLVTFGKGGCGFFGASADPICQPVRRVFCTFEFASSSIGGGVQTVEVQGNLIYLQTFNLNKKEVYYYGIEFLEAHQHRIQPIVDSLESLAKEGKVNYA